MFSYDAPPGGAAPTYGGAADSDPCPLAGSSWAADGCVGQTRVVRLEANAAPALTGQQVLLSDVCRQFQLHDGGGLRQGPDGQLYASLGDGADTYLDTGQRDGNPCGDPLGEGGSLRSQDARTPDDPLGYSGSVVRIDPDTAAVEQLAYGLRNPFRLALRPGTTEVWVGDVGYERVEEVNRLPADGVVRNYGWPCYEGPDRHAIWDDANIPICEALYANPTATTPPAYSFCHAGTAPSCTRGEGAVSGVEFYAGGSYPPKYDGALFVADYTRRAITVIYADANGVPDPRTAEPFATDIGFPVDVRTGPGGDLFYVDIYNGTVNRLYVGDPSAPPDPGLQPEATITTPVGTEGTTVGGQLSFSGYGTETDGRRLPASALRWTLALLHCTGETTCHRHFVEDEVGVTEGSFDVPAHEGSYRMEVVLRVTGATGSDQTSVALSQQPVAPK